MLTSKSVQNKARAGLEAFGYQIDDPDADLKVGQAACRRYPGDKDPDCIQDLFVVGVGFDEGLGYHFYAVKKAWPEDDGPPSYDQDSPIFVLPWLDMLVPWKYPVGATVKICGRGSRNSHTNFLIAAIIESVTYRESGWYSERVTQLRP